MKSTASALRTRPVQSLVVGCMTTNEDSGNRQVGCQDSLLGDWTIDLRRQRATDLPVMAERIDHAAQAPPVRLLHWKDLSCTSGNRFGEQRVRVWDGQDHSNGTATQRLRTEVAMLRGLVTQPELRAIYL